MKIVVTYEPADLIRLIRHDLALQGITAEDADIKFVKNKAVVAVDVAPDAAPALLLHDAAVSPPILTGPTKQLPNTTLVDDDSFAAMSEIQRASANLTAQKSGKFPAPTRHLIEGESFDFPGSKTR